MNSTENIMEIGMLLLEETLAPLSPTRLITIFTSISDSMAFSSSRQSRTDDLLVLSNITSINQLPHPLITNSTNQSICVMLNIIQFIVLSWLIMATQRIKNMETIQQPYQRTNNQIQHLQAKDKILQSSIISLRDRIQNSRNQRNCKACKIYQDQIVMIKNQQKQKINKLQQTIKRLEEENISMAHDINQLNSKKMTFLAKEEKTKQNLLPYEISSINSGQMQKIVNQTNLLNSIDETNNQLQYRQRREREILNKLRKRKERPHTNKSQMYNLNNNEHQILLYVSEIESKYQHLEQFKNQLQKELQEKNKLKEQDSLRIMNLLNQIDKTKHQQQNIENHHQIKCRQIEQEKDRIIFQLGFKQKNLQNQINSLKSYIQSSNRIKQSLNKLKQAKQAEISTLKQEKNDLQIVVGKIKGQFQFMSKDIASKEQYIANLHSSLSLIEANNLQLQKQLSQCKHLYDQSNLYCKILAQEVANLKQYNLKIQSIPNTFNKQSQEQIQYLKNMLNQSHLVISSREDNINRLQNQLSPLKLQNKALKEREEHNLIALTMAQELNNQRNKYIKYLEKEKSEIIRTMQNTIKQKEILQSNISKEIQSKSNFANKYILEAERNGQLYKRCSNIQRQFEEYKRTKNTHSQIAENNKVIIDQLSHQLSSTKIALDKIIEQNKHLKMISQDLHLQINGLKQQFQLNMSLKEGRQKEIESKNKQLEQVIFFNNQMYQDIEHFRAQNHFLLNKLRELQHIFMETQQNYNRSTIQLQQAELQRISLIQSINQHQSRIHILEQLHLTQKQNFQQIVNSQRDQLLMRKQDIKDRERIIEQERQASSIITKINTELQNKNQKYSQEKVHLEKYVSELLHELTAIKKINESLPKVSTPTIKAKDQRHEQMSKIYEQNQQKTFRIVQLQDKLSELQSQFEKLQLQNEKLSKKNQMLIESQSKNTENIIYLNQKIQSLNKVYLAPNGQTTEELIKQLNKKKQMITQLLTNFKYVEKALNSKEAEFNQLAEKHEKLGKLAGKQKFELGDKLIAKEAELNSMKREKDEESKRWINKIKQMEKMIAHLQDQLKQKDRQQIQEKRQTQKQLNRVAQQKKKLELTSCKEIMHLKETLQSQKKRSNQASLTTSPAKQEEPKKKESDQNNFKKIIEDNKRRIHHLQQLLREKELELEKLRNLVQQKDIQIQEMNDLLTETQVHYDVKSHQLEKYQSKINSYQGQIERLKSYIASIHLKYKLDPQQDISTKSIKPCNQEQNLIEGIQVSQQINK